MNFVMMIMLCYGLRSYKNLWGFTRIYIMETLLSQQVFVFFVMQSQYPGASLQKAFLPGNTQILTHFLGKPSRSKLKWVAQYHHPSLFPISGEGIFLYEKRKHPGNIPDACIPVSSKAYTACYPNNRSWK